MVDMDSSSGEADGAPIWRRRDLWGWPEQEPGTRERLDPKPLEASLTAALSDDRFKRLTIVHAALSELLEAERIDGSLRDFERLSALALGVLDQAQERLRLIRPPLSPLQHQRLRTALDVLHQLALLELRLGASKASAVPSREARVRAFALWAEHSLLRWSFYQPSDGPFWARCAALLNSLIEDDALTTTITLPRPRLGLTTVSASELFARLAVVAASQPSALPYEAGLTLFAWSGETPLTVEQSRRRPIPNTPSIVTFDLNAQHAPLILSDVRLPMRAGLWFSLEPLVQRLRDARIENLARAPNAPTSANHGPADQVGHLRDHLIRMWTHKPTRRHSRVPVDGAVIALTGLRAIHDQLEESSRRRRFAAERSARTATAVDGALTDIAEANEPGTATHAAGSSDRTTSEGNPSVGRRGEMQVFVMPESADAPAWQIDHTTPTDLDSTRPLGARDLGTPESAWLAAERGLDAVPPANPAPTKDSKARQWTLRNRSAGGLSLQIREAPPGALLIGELLGLATPRPPSDPATADDGALQDAIWQIGILRWLQETQPNVLEAGVERIASDPAHGEAFLLRNRRAYGDPVPVLMARDERLGASTVLILPAHHFVKESSVVLSIAGVSRIVDLLPPEGPASPLFQMRRFNIRQDALLSEPAQTGDRDLNRADPDGGLSIL